MELEERPEHEIKETFFLFNISCLTEGCLFFNLANILKEKGSREYGFEMLFPIALDATDQQ